MSTIDSGRHLYVAGKHQRQPLLDDQHKGQLADFLRRPAKADIRPGRQAIADVVPLMAGR